MTTTASLDRQVVKAAGQVRVLSSLRWPAEIESQFLHAWSRGERTLPQPPPVVVDPALDEPLADAMKRADLGDPRQAFIARTAASYRAALAMLQASGTPAFAQASVELYGTPRTPPVPGGPSVLDEARHLLNTIEVIDVPPVAPHLSAEEAQEWLQAQVDLHFKRHLPVVLDPHLSSLAAAGSSRVRLRGGVRYAQVQLEQFLQHEALVHSATKRNGRAQKKLRCLGLSSPRTTAVQEGLATLSELITDSLDVRRLRRIAMRVVTVDNALQGADFIDVFESLLDTGQTPAAAFRSSMRVFRGADCRGGSAFTKDIVYLQGLRRVHTFMLTALRHKRADLPEVLFAGRMTCSDALALAPLLEDGTLTPPETVAPWVARTDRLAAYLAWAAFGQRIDPVSLSAFRD